MHRALVIATIGGILVAVALAVSLFALPGPDEDDSQPGATVQRPTAGADGKGSGGLIGLPTPKKGAGNALQAPREAGRTNDPRFDIVRISPKGRAVIAGRASPGAVVTVLDGSKPIGTVKADGRGEWVLVPSKPLAPGGRTLSLRAKQPDGSTVESEGEVVLVVPEPGRDIAGRKTGDESGAIALRVPRSRPGAAQSGPLASKVFQAPGGGVRAKRQKGGLFVDSIDYDLKGNVAIGGTARPGARVRVYIDNRPMGVATADKEGHWSFRPESTLKPGTYRLRVDELGSGGQVARRIEIPFSRAAALTELPEGGVVVVQPGDNLWQLARGTYGSGFQYTVIFEANKQQIRDPDLIYPGQIFTLPRKAPVN